MVRKVTFYVLSGISWILCVMGLLSCYIGLNTAFASLAIFSEDAVGSGTSIHAIVQLVWIVGIFGGMLSTWLGSKLADDWAKPISVWVAATTARLLRRRHICLV